MTNDSSNPSHQKSSLIEYLDECSEMLERFSKNLGLIESAEPSSETLSAIYRDMHTIKGSSHLFGFNQVGQLAHAMESCLDPVRKGQMNATPALVDILYDGCDMIASLLAGIREHDKEPNLHEQIGSLVPRLVEIVEAAATGATPATQDKAPSSHHALATEEFHTPSQRVLPEQPESISSAAPVNAIPIKDKLAVAADQKTQDEHPGFVIFDDLPTDAPRPPTKRTEALPEAATTSQSPVAAAAAPKPDSKLPSAKAPEQQKSPPEDSQAETIRVHVSLLDNLMNLIGELVLIRNQLLQYAKVNDEDAEFTKMSQRLDILTAELQSEVMKTRMQPVGNVLSKFTRVVRDMGRELGKKIELDIQGGETELDKTIIEAVKDPLTHIVRNSIDHGIETTAERRAHGKSETGHIAIHAHHESGQVIIEISDDGRGLDPKRIGSKAVEKGLLTAEALSKMTDRDVQSLIFSPGFSTAAAVSNISGRGVGMDVVKTNVERIGGVVDLTSVPLSGTTIKLKIPLTLAIVPALIVRAMNQRFAIPQSKLVELVRIDPSDPSGLKIESLQGTPVLRLRGRIRTLLRLSEVLASTRASKVGGQASSTAPNDSSINIVILNADNFQFGLIVDTVEDTADIVVKALPSFLKELSHFSGATIMGDGSVALTIDVMGLCAATRSNPEIDLGLTTANEAAQKLRSKHQMDVTEFLLVDVGAPSSYAIPLTLVSRLEEFDASTLVLSGEQKVVRYRDRLLPIFSLPKFLKLPFQTRQDTKAKIPVVVIRRGDHLYGIEVEQIQDVVALPSHIDQTLRDRPGILGTMVADKNILVVVDIFGMIDAINASMATTAGIASPGTTLKASGSGAKVKRGDHRVLLAEDSSFFRNHIRQVLTAAGFSIETACDGAEAWKTLDLAQAGHFALVMSDIEMPIMDGLEFAAKVSSDRRFKDLPLVAITTRFSSADIERGRQAGFARYLEKLNADRLIAELDELLMQSAKPREQKHAANQ